MGRKGLLALTLIGGASLVSLAVAADVVGLGPRDFGLEQKLGVVVGSTVAWFSALRLAGWSPGASTARESARSAPAAVPSA
jgi:hypothetical protein